MAPPTHPASRPSPPTTKGSPTLPSKEKSTSVRREVVHKPRVFTPIFRTLKAARMFRDAEEKTKDEAKKGGIPERAAAGLSDYLGIGEREGI